jgi:hypothetical protein
MLLLSECFATQSGNFWIHSRVWAVCRVVPEEMGLFADRGIGNFPLHYLLQTGIRTQKSSSLLERDGSFPCDKAADT